MKKEKITNNIIPAIVFVVLFLIISGMIGILSNNNQTTILLLLLVFDIMLLIAVILENKRNKNLSLLFTVLFSFFIFYIGEFFGLYVGRTADKTSDFYSYKGMLVGLIFLVSYYLLTLVITSMLLSNKSKNRNQAY